VLDVRQHRGAELPDSLAAAGGRARGLIDYHSRRAVFSEIGSPNYTCSPLIERLIPHR
jgi:hypothetical protein